MPGCGSSQEGGGALQTRASPGGSKALQVISQPTLFWWCDQNSGIILISYFVMWRCCVYWINSHELMTCENIWTWHWQLEIIRRHDRRGEVREEVSEVKSSTSIAIKPGVSINSKNGVFYKAHIWGLSFLQVCKIKFFIKWGNFLWKKSLHFHEIHHFWKAKDPWFHEIHHFWR